MGWFDWLFPVSNHDRKMCKNKVRYDNESSARAAIARINPDRTRHKPNRTYKCPRCAGYHLTKASKY